MLPTLDLGAAVDSSDPPILALGVGEARGPEFDLDLLDEQVSFGASSPLGARLFDTSRFWEAYTNAEGWRGVHIDLPVATSEADEEETEPAWQEMAEYLQERSAFRALLPTLETYKGKFVAVHDGRVVDSDASTTILLRRFFSALGDASVYIGFVGDVQPTTRVVTPFRRI